MKKYHIWKEKISNYSSDLFQAAMHNNKRRMKRERDLF